MRLINQEVEKIPFNMDYKKSIELAGRVCYKSEDKITNDSCQKFVQKMIDSGHTAMLEHGTIYLSIPIEYNCDNNSNPLYLKYIVNKYSKTHIIDKIHYITTNYRVLVENDWLEDLEYLCEPTEYHEKVYSFRIICSRAIANELVRHRVFSFAQESTRYCNYSKNKFDNGLTFIKPNWYNIAEKNNTFLEEMAAFEAVCNLSEDMYLKLVKTLEPQLARDVLPLSLKTEIIMTGYKSDWDTFLKLRDSNSKAHPDMQIIAEEIKKQII